MPTGLVSKNDIAGIILTLICIHTLLCAGEAQVPPSMAGCYAAIWPPTILSQPEDTRTEQSHPRGNTQTLISTR